MKSFKALHMDLTASSLEGKRVDQNGDVAALIKVVTTETGFVFEGGTLGIVDTKLYRYIYKDFGDHADIQRLPLRLLDTTEAIDGWETVKVYK